MARLKCKSCEQFFDLNGTLDINCPHCGELLTNSFTEWIKKPGHENRTFEDYKRKKCYPSNSSSKVITNSHIQTHSHNSHSSSHSNPYKKIQRSAKEKKRFQKRIYIISAIVLIHLIALFTNPNLESHKKAFHEKLFGEKHIDIARATIIEKDEIDDPTWRYKSLLVDIEKGISVNDYLIFSVTNLKWSKKNYPIGFGIFGFVFITDEVERLKKQF